MTILPAHMFVVLLTVLLLLLLLVVFPTQRCWQSGGTPALGLGRVVCV